MRRAGIVISLLVALGAIAWWISRDARVPANGGTRATTSSGAPDSDALESRPLDAVADGRGTDAASSTSDPAPSELAATPNTIHAAHALAPDEPTVVRGRVVDRNGAKQAGCRVLAAPQVPTPSVGLKPGRVWPLDAVAIDRDGTRERRRQGRSDPDLDRDDEIARVRHVTTDAEGRFELRGLPSGPIRIALRSPSLAPRDLDDLVLEAREMLDLGDLALDFPLVLEGEVLDQEGRAIGNARIDRVDSFESNATQPGPAMTEPLAITAANGRFRTAPLAHGSFGLLASHPDFLEQRIDGAWEDTKRTPAAIVFKLGTAVALQGNVFGPPPDELATLCVLADPERTWRDTARSRGGEVSAESPRLGATSDQRSARVASDGRFHMDGLDPLCAHTLRVGPLTSRGDELACVYLIARAPAGARAIDLVVPRGGVLSFEARSLRSNTPVEEFEVRIAGAAPESLVDETGVALGHHPGGAFRLSGVRFPSEPPQRLAIAALGYATYTVDLYALSGGDVPLGVVLLEPLHTLDVFVTDDVTGAPIEGARVRAGEEDAVRQARLGRPSDTTDDAGRARVTSYNLEGSYVWVAADGSAPSVVGFGEHAWDPAAMRCNISLARGARARVHVSDRDGAPLPGIGVTASTEMVRPAPAVSDAEGVATFEHLGRGRATFSCSQLRRPASDSAAEVYLDWNSDLDVWITSPGIGRLAGRVLDGVRPVIGAELTLWAQGAIEWKPWHGVSDSTGAFHFENLEFGRFTITVAVDRSVGPTSFDVVVESRETKFDVDLASAHLRGRVLDARGRAQPDAVVWFVAVDAPPPNDVVTSLERGDSGYAESLVESVRFRDGAGRLLPCFTTDSNGAFDVILPREASEFVVSAAHDRAGSGWARVDRTHAGEGALDVEVRLVPAGSLELRVNEAPPRGTSLVLLLPVAEPSACLIREGRVGESIRWGALAAGEWKAWNIGVWLDHGELRVRTSQGPLPIEITAGHTTAVSLPID